jgi:hypothetical protein
MAQLLLRICLSPNETVRARATENVCEIARPSVKLKINKKKNKQNKKKMTYRCDYNNKY